jgi:signal transduction histidine kinase
VAAQIAGVIANHRSHARALNAERARITVEAQKRELEVLEEQRVQFLSTVSHELKTPLTSLTAFADFLGRNRESNLSERQLEQIQVMQRSARRLDVLTDDFLDLSKIDANRFVFTWAEFDLNDLLNELVGEFAPMTQDKNQKIILERSENQIILCADRTRVAQVVSNVLCNATK